MTTAASSQADRQAMLRQRYQALLCDLDGTLYRGGQVIEGAPQLLAAGTERIVYVTNNSSRSPLELSERLTHMGFAAPVEDIVTSGQAGARLLADKLAAASKVLIIGTEALADQVSLVGLDPVRTYAENPVAVLQGRSDATTTRQLSEAAYAIAAGALWVATNADATMPDERGFALGNGALVAALQKATGAVPIVAGKPDAPLLDTALNRTGRAALVVGDNLHTDIAGANEVGVDSLLVLTGVATLSDTIAAPSAMRPTYVAQALSALDRPVASWDGTVDSLHRQLEAGGAVSFTTPHHLIG